MGGLPQALRLQHRAAETLLGKITSAVEAGAMDQIGPLLDELEETLTQHLKTEDEQIYRALEENARRTGEHDLATAIRDFASSMHFITETARAFFARYQDQPDREGFRGDWAVLCDELRARILAEEATIFPLFERANAEKAPVR